MSEQPPIPDLKPVLAIDYSTPAAEIPHGLRYRIRRWRRERLTRENIVSHLKTLAWVVPLTLLIWVYAEREQITTFPGEPVPFTLVSLDPNRIVSLVDPKQDKNLVVDLSGPQARVQEVLDKIRGGTNESPRGLRLEVNSSLSPGKEHEINAVQLLRDQKIFSDYGVSVLGCQPVWLMVRIDPIVERDAKIVPPPDVTNLNSSSFDPPIVRVRGPKSKLDEAAQQNGRQLVVYAEIPEDVRKSPGHHEISNVSVEWPPKLEDDRISILSPPVIKASLDVRAADVSGKINSMPVYLEMPNIVVENIQSGRWKVDLSVFKPSLSNVHIVGPKAIVDQINNPDFSGKRPVARIEVTPDDLGEIKQKQVTFDLPDGVHAAGGDQNRTVDFRLITTTAHE